LIKRLLRSPTPSSNPVVAEVANCLSMKSTGRRALLKMLPRENACFMPELDRGQLIAA